MSDVVLMGQLKMLSRGRCYSEKSEMGETVHHFIYIYLTTDFDYDLDHKG